jgi:hypothetical protein
MLAQRMHAHTCALSGWLRPACARRPRLHALAALQAQPGTEVHACHLSPAALLAGKPQFSGVEATLLS